MTRQEQFVRSHKRFHRNITLAQIGLFLFFLLLWEVAAYVGWIDSFFFCSPSIVANCFFRMLLKEYSLWDVRNKKPDELSGGMRQRAALIRTLVLNPDLFLLDEPFSALDFQTRIEVADDISSIIRDRGKTVILITHDLQEAISLADRIIVLSNRPAHLVRDIKIQLTCEEKGVLAARSAPEFNDYFNLLWDDLKGKEDS